MSVHALIMDASPVRRQSLKQALTESRLAEFTFAEAGTCEEVRLRFDPDTTDLVFVAVDVKMAVSIVFRLVAALRAMQKRPLHIVLVGSESTLQRLDLVGADRTLIWPVHPKSARAHLEPLLEPAGSTR